MSYGCGGTGARDVRRIMAWCFLGTKADECRAALARDCGQNAEGKDERDRSLEFPGGIPATVGGGLPERCDIAADFYVLVINIGIGKGLAFIDLSPARHNSVPILMQAAHARLSL